MSVGQTRRPVSSTYVCQFQETKVYGRSMHSATKSGFLSLALLFVIVATAAPADRSPLPRPAEVAEAVELIREVFESDYDRLQSDQDKSMLAKKLLAETKSATSLANHYGLLDEAKRLAEESSDVALAMMTVDRIAERFTMDALVTKASCLWSLSKNLRSKETHQEVVDTVEDLIDQSIQKEQFELSEKLCEFAVETSKKGRLWREVKIFIDRGRQIDELREEFVQVQESLRALDGDPTNRESNLAAGKYFCFTRGDWDRGLPMLALSSHEALSQISAAELRGTESVESKLSLGDRWWELAEKNPEDRQAMPMRRRAAHHYLAALPNTTGLLRKRVEARLEQMAASSGGDAKAETEPPPIELNDLEMLLTFDNDSLSTEADVRYFRDYSGNQNRGTVVKVGAAEGVAGEAAAFNGTDTGVIITRVIADDFTISFWVRTNQQPKSGKHWHQGCCLVDGEVPWWTGDFGTSVLAGRFAFGTGVGNGDKTIRSVSNIADGQWHHCCAIRDKESGRIAVFVNGRKEAEGTNSSHSLQKPKRLTIGRRQTGGAHFAGHVDELIIFSRCLTAEEVAEIYRLGKQRKSLARFVQEIKE